MTDRETLLKEALAIMEAEHSRPLRVNEVAARVATSRRHLQRCFQDHLGESFRERLLTVRLERARELLMAPDVTIAEASSRVGYIHPRKFCEAFRRRYGMSPSAWRATAVR